MIRNLAVLWIALLGSSVDRVEGRFAFQTSSSSSSSSLFQQRIHQSASKDDDSALGMAANKGKIKKKAGGGASVGLKGFGAQPATAGVETDRSKQAMKFYDFLEQNGAGDNLSRCALGYFPLAAGDAPKLRGVVALKDLKKGDNIIRIPYELAINLGPEGADPTGPALALLQAYCQSLGGGEDESSSSSSKQEEVEEASNVDETPYFELLPPFLGDDCLGSTDFFSDQALEALQTPMVVAETLKRRQRTQARFVALKDDFKWIDGTPLTEEHLQWAVWLITSRVLTVQGDADEGNSYRLLIPFLDMCNHDRLSPHILTGRAVPGGELKVVAGANVKAGDQINICYGGGMAGNDRFLQDYGFIDTSDKEMAFLMVAQQLLGKRNILEGSSAGRKISEADREATLEQLRKTTMQEDAQLLESEKDPALRSTYQYRLGVKKALSKFVVIQ
jgi:hypothetical protein